MEDKKRQGETSGRFGESVGSKRPTGSYRTPPAGSYRSRPGYQQGQRRPTGFGTVGAKEAPRSEAETKAEAKEKKRLAKRLAKEQRRLDRKERSENPQPKQTKRKEPKKARRGLKALLIALCGALVFIVLLVILFGNSTEGYHQLPTITRQEEPESSAGPETTPTIVFTGEAYQSAPESQGEILPAEVQP